MMKYVWCWRCAEWQRSFVEEKRKEVIRDYRCCPECLNAGAGWLRNWTSWASLEKHHWTHISRSDMASRSGIASRSDIVGRLEVCSFSCWPGCRSGPMVHIFTLHCASGVKTDGRRASGAKNSIEQHGVSAWPAGHPIESQHGLLVVQGSISMACWSSKGVSAWPAGRPSPACLNTRTFVLTSASPFSTHPFQHTHLRAHAHAPFSTHPVQHSTTQRTASPPV